MGGLDREPALADPARADEADDPVEPSGEQCPDLGQLPVAPDGRGVRLRYARCERRRRLRRLFGAEGAAGLIEPFGEHRRQVAGDLVGELVRSGEGDIRGGVVGPDPRDELAQAFVALDGRLDVDELRHRPRREVVLVLEARDRFVGRDPAIARAVDPDEDVALGEIGAVQRAWGMRSRTQFEHHRRQMQTLDRGPHRDALVRELAQRRADEDPQSLIGRPDDSRERFGHADLARAARSAGSVAIAAAS
nr:hypothetical protein [Microbacterium yannicii]